MSEFAYIEREVRTRLSNMSGYFPPCLPEFVDFSGKVARALSGVVVTRGDAEIAVQLVMGSVGDVVVRADDDYTRFGDHHAYPSYSVEKLDVEEALRLIERPVDMRRMIEQRRMEV